ncbi:PilN domain-containing protein [Atopomonas sediminilitoris]|uniref:PilN domain-containing protein n=1 Tax=Atopomonas sediminilitoris TaxID=2919919 RepID=UPI001F4DC571|nr:PilN domain-containing protein [Atopomonas sediminilitoris]MCJ8168400.1 PilN domain-containing protein [Atopomonas sediminilitoris]
MRNINLFRPDSPRRQITPVMRYAQIGALVLAVLMLLHGSWMGWQLHQAKQQSARLLVGADLVQQERATLEADFKAPVLDENLPKQLETIEQMNRELSQLGDYLRLLEHQASGGYAMLLDGLAQQHRAGVWLTRIRLHEGLALLRLEGAALTQAQVKPYLDALGEHAAFTGRRFSQFELKRDEGGFQRFILSSEASTEERVQ